MLIWRIACGQSLSQAYHQLITRPGHVPGPPIGGPPAVAAMPVTRLARPSTTIVVVVGDGMVVSSALGPQATNNKAIGQNKNK